MKQRAVQTNEKPVITAREKLGNQLLSFAQMARKRGNTEVAEAALEWEKAIQERLSTPQKKAA